MALRGRCVACACALPCIQLTRPPFCRRRGQPRSCSSLHQFEWCWYMLFMRLEEHSAERAFLLRIVGGPGPGRSSIPSGSVHGGRDAAGHRVSKERTAADRFRRSVCRGSVVVSVIGPQRRDADGATGIQPAASLVGGLSSERCGIIRRSVRPAATAEWGVRTPIDRL